MTFETGLDAPAEHDVELNAWRLVCAACGSTFDVAPMFSGCPSCARLGKRGFIELEFRPRHRPAPPSRRNGRGLARFLDLLPCTAESFVSLGEGDTPLIASTKIGPALGLMRLFFKNDTVNPSWSFKDRYVAVSVAVARHFNFRRMVVSSTGNLGVSAAAYCARSAIECCIIASEGAPPSALDQARAHGAAITITENGRRQDLFEEIASDDCCFPLGLFLPRAVMNPFGVEGYKTFAYELVEALSEAPDTVIFPCARGNALYGAWKGFCEARAWGWTAGRLPKLVASQPVGADSLAQSVRTGAPEPIELPAYESIAHSTSERVAGPHALAAIRSSGGSAFAIAEAEIAAAQLMLARDEGLYVEASSALPIAALRPALQSGILDRNAPVVCILTGSGSRWGLMAAP